MLGPHLTKTEPAHAIRSISVDGLQTFVTTLRETARRTLETILSSHIDAMRQVAWPVSRTHTPNTDASNG